MCKMCTHQVPEPNVRQLVRNRRDDLRVVRVAVRAVVVEQVVGTGIYTGIKKYFIFIYVQFHLGDRVLRESHEPPVLHRGELVVLDRHHVLLWQRVLNAEAAHEVVVDQGGDLGGQLGLEKIK